MSKKTLLNESTVRKFMKFANIGALTENFVSETYSMEEEEAEEVAEKETAPKKRGRPKKETVEDSTE